MQSNSKSIVRFENVFFTYDGNEQNNDYVLNDVSFDFKKGEYVCIVGHNGSGKSTLSKIISCLLKPQRGNYYIDNQLLTKKTVDTLRKKIGVIFQNPDNQFIGLSAEDDIAFGLENYCVEPTKMKMIIDNTAQIININNLLDREAILLSGGQKQKVAIASVISLIPDVIIFDESTSMLDPQAKLEIKDLMKFLQTKYNRTVISITHDMEELINADKILCLEKGKVAKFCTLDELLKDQSFLKKSRLDLPFCLKLSSELIKKGLKIKSTPNIDTLVREICKK